MRTKKDVRRNLSVILCAVVVSAGFAGSASADHSLITEPVIQGEQANLLRHAYDYLHRNSNRNVFRKSRSNHPTNNIFRSSRYYKQKVAASSDGYPLRTYIRFDRSVNGGPPQQIEYNYAHPQGSPLGLPFIEEPGLEALVLGNDAFGRPHSQYARDYSSKANARRTHTRRYGRQEQRPRHEYRMITPDGIDRPFAGSDSMPSKEPRQDAVWRQVRGDDGSVRTIITNAATVSDEKEVEGNSIDDGWALLNSDNADAAADVFKRYVMDATRGNEAMVGYGLAQLVDGDLNRAAGAFRRARKLDEQILIRVIVDEPLRARLEPFRQQDLDSGDITAADVETINAALTDLLD